MTDIWRCGDCGTEFVPDEQDRENADLWATVMCKPCEAKCAEEFARIMTRPAPAKPPTTRVIRFSRPEEAKR